MSKDLKRHYGKRKDPNRPFEASVVVLLRELDVALEPILDSTYTDHSTLEAKAQEALKKTFGTVHKGYGSLTAVRNMLRSLNKR